MSAHLPRQGDDLGVLHGLFGETQDFHRHFRRGADQAWAARGLAARINHAVSDIALSARAQNDDRASLSFFGHNSRLPGELVLCTVAKVHSTSATTTRTRYPQGIENSHFGLAEGARP